MTWHRGRELLATMNWIYDLPDGQLLAVSASIPRRKWRRFESLLTMDNRFETSYV
jgi:hypothetical protein